MWLVRKNFYKFLVLLAMCIVIMLFESNLVVVDGERKEARIFCMILTQAISLNSKARAVNQTWAKECDKHFFILRINSSDSSKTIETYDPLPILQPADYAQESYRKLTDKVFRTYKHVHHAYSDYDWYLKADDDTYVFMDHLREFLKDKDPLMPIVYGYNWNMFTKGGYESGGAGYVLSRVAMRRLGETLSQNYSFCLNSGVEDIDTTRCLRELNVTSGETRDSQMKNRFNAFSIRNEYEKNNDSLSETAITFHYMYADEMYKLHAAYRDYKNNESKTRGTFTSLLYSIL